MEALVEVFGSGVQAWVLLTAVAYVVFSLLGTV